MSVLSETNDPRKPRKSVHILQKAKILHDTQSSNTTLNLELFSISSFQDELKFYGDLWWLGTFFKKKHESIGPNWAMKN